MPAPACAPAPASITVNGAPFEPYFPTATQRMVVTEPLRVVEPKRATTSTPRCTVAASPARPARCAWPSPASLVELDPDARASLKKAGLLTRDPRRKESKKYGLVKARKAKQYTKR